MDPAMTSGRATRASYNAMSCPAPIRERSDGRPFSATTILPGFTTDDARHSTYTPMRHPFHHRNAPIRRLLGVVESHGQRKLIYESAPDQEHRESNPILANMDGGGADETRGDHATKGAASDRAAVPGGKRVIGDEDDEDDPPDRASIAPGQKRVFETGGRGSP